MVVRCELVAFVGGGMNRRNLFDDWLPPRIARALRRSRLPLVGARPLNQLDRRLLPYLPKRGTYIELGANDGLSQSNTWWLERDHGWSGLLIEPTLNRYLELVRNRGSKNFFACAACVPMDYPDSAVRLTYGDLMTTTSSGLLIAVDEEAHARAARNHVDHQVTTFAQARTLSSLIDEAGIGPTIDFLSLDVEGAELMVLEGVDFSRHSIRWILVETRDQDAITLFLEARGYAFVKQFSEHDFLFRRTN